jgi:hypothetical protein
MPFEQWINRRRGFDISISRFVVDETAIVFIGFSLSEGVISSAADIDSFDIVRLDDGVERLRGPTQPLVAFSRRSLPSS